jgi:hypothetical protein
MQEIEREALGMQLQDKLLAYKRDMGLLPAAPDGVRHALPAEGESGASDDSGAAVVDNGGRSN